MTDDHEQGRGPADEARRLDVAGERAEVEAGGQAAGAPAETPEQAAADGAEAAGGPPAEESAEVETPEQAEADGVEPFGGQPAEEPARVDGVADGSARVGTGEAAGDGAESVGQAGVPLELGAVDGDDGPVPLSDDDLECALEALLLVVDSPTEEEAFAAALGTTPVRVAERLRLLSNRYTDQDRGIDLRRAGGGWRFYTRDRYAPYVEKLLLDGQRAKLTRAALETLAVIAYRQPVTRARVAAVRGVNCDGVIRTLLTRGLVEETGTDAETGGFLYRTTELFLERLGLSSLEDLPPIAPLLPEVDSIDEL